MEKRYIKSFQGFRFIAALLIFLFHCNFILDFNLKTFSAFGPVGVSFFFILSGYLNQLKIAGGGGYYDPSVIKQTKHSLIVNGKKFFPLHWITLLIGVCLDLNLFFETPLQSITIFLLNATLLHAWIPIQAVYYSFNSGAWFLSVMLFWAIISPLATKLILKLKKRGSILVILTIFIIEFILSAISDFTKIGFWLVYIFPLSRAMDMISGCAIYQFVHSCDKKLSGLENDFLMFGSIMVIVGLYISQFYFNSAIYSAAVWNLPILGVVVSLAGGDENSKIISRVFGNKAAVYLGNITFEFYLFHQLVLRFGNAGYHYFGIAQDGWLVVISFIVTLMLSIAFHNFIVWFHKDINQKRSVTKRKERRK